MAGRRSELYRVFHADSQLKSYFLDGVTSTGKTLGTGAYGSVMEVHKLMGRVGVESSNHLGYV